MVVVPLPGGGSFCIDSTETTNAEYKAFLDAAAPFTEQPPVCAWNQSYLPAFDSLARPPDLPVIGIDWCDAHAYCAWAGKRLCGRIGGGGLTPPEQMDPMKSQWTYACSHGGMNQYPYGASYEPKSCVTVDVAGNAEQPWPVKALSTCVGGYPGIFDMSGNADEWEDVTLVMGPGGDLDAVLWRGGSFAETASTTDCFSATSTTRSAQSAVAGVRCCKD
jgi:formylglycine-generating enzyme required for sulfatase activity